MWWLAWTIVSVAAVLTVGILMGILNARLKTRWMVVEHAREGLELQLKRRHETIDNMLEPIRRDSSFDLDMTDNVSFLARRARQTLGFAEREHFEIALAESLKDLLTAVDNSPELPANESYAKARQHFEEVESDMRNADRFYNDAVQQYNALLEFFLNRIVARLFSFTKAESFEVFSAIPDPVVAYAHTHKGTVPAPKSIQRQADAIHPPK